MGVDLMSRRGGGSGYTWDSWRSLHRLGTEYGWEPEGTIMDDYEMKLQGQEDVDGSHKKYCEEWKGSYFSNEFQIVTNEDADNWRLSLEKALKDPKYLNSRDRLPVLMIQGFIDFLVRGAFRIY